MKKLLSALALGAVLAAPAMAADSPWYIGAQMGHSQLNGLNSADNDGTSISGVAGYQLAPNWAAEVGVSRLGDINVNGARGKSEFVSIQGVGLLPVAERVKLFGKAGVAYTHLRDEMSGHRFTPIVGVGAEYALDKNTSAVFEVQYLHNFAGTQAHAMNTGLGLKYRF